MLLTEILSIIHILQALDEILTIIHTLQAFKNVIRTIDTHETPAVTDIHTLARTGMDLENRNDLYVSNKQACVDIITQVSLLRETITTINKQFPSTYPEQLKGHVQNLKQCFTICS
jgi:hypothetical protein